MVSKVHLLTHASAEYMKMVFMDSKIGSIKRCEAFYKRHAESYIRASTGRPRNLQQIFLIVPTPLGDVKERYNERANCLKS